MFRTVPLSIISSFFYCTHCSGICHTGLLCVQWKTADDGQMNCPKHVEFYSKNKFEKFVDLVGFIIRIYHDARSPERQTRELYKPHCQVVVSRTHTHTHTHKHVY